MTSAETDVLAERARQRDKWGDDHDACHPPGTLAEAGIAYARGDLSQCPFNYLGEQRQKIVSMNYRERLVRAAALMLAEIDRLDGAPPSNTAWKDMEHG